MSKNEAKVVHDDMQIKKIDPQKLSNQRISVEPFDKNIGFKTQKAFNNKIGSLVKQNTEFSP